MPLPSDLQAARGRLDSIVGLVRSLQPAAELLSSIGLLDRIREPFARRYGIERELGRGGMAVVFLAEDLKHRRKVALKILRPELTSDIGNSRFLKEISIVARLTHPHILPLHDSGELVGLLYYVMPYVEGESLRDRLKRDGPLPVADALRVAREVADALGYAHARGVIHRDIKPENILLESGHAVVSDFGIALAMKAAGGEDLAEAAIALGTPAYMSPEQARGDPDIDGRTDIYSLGCVLHEMATGESPFRGTTTESVLEQHLDAAPPRSASLPAPVADVISRAMSKSPQRRYATAAELEAALTHAAARASMSPWLSGRRGAAVAAAVIGTGVLAATLLTPSRTPLHPAALVVTVLPFVPVEPDSTLARIGRDLVVTLSASLAGVNEMRTVDALTVLAQTRDRGTVSRDEGLRLAARLGSTGILHGTIARVDSMVEVELELVAVDGGRGVAHVARTVDPRDINAATDTLAWALLREVWRRRAPPTPNLAAVTTRSIPALREFLDGERAALESRWDAAAEAYARAMRADSTFWLAYWRYAFARWWYLEAVDGDIIEAIQLHRHALPERDRLVFESWVTDTFSVAIARSGEVVTRYPDYWPGWMQHGDWLFHVGPVYGFDAGLAKTALRRAVELNPALLPGWEHLYWVAIADDTATAAEALDALQRLGFGRAAVTEFGFDVGRVYRLELGMLRTGVIDSRLRDSIVVELVTSGRGRLGGGATLAPAQIAISEQVLRARPRPQLAALHERLLADAWASRGAWDSALVVADRNARRGGPSDALNAYRVAVIGGWLGELRASEAEQRRAAADHAVERPSANLMLRAELAWLDGLAAAARRDGGGLSRARERLRRSDTVSTALLERTLGAFEAELHGERRLAAATLAATNWRNPDLLVPGYSAHPYVIAVSRLAAGRWLAAEGDTAEALGNLRWFDAAWALDGYRPARRVLAPVAALERARLAGAVSPAARP